MAWMTGMPWQTVSGWNNIAPTQSVPVAAPAPAAPAGGGYWAQLSSLLGMPQAGPAYAPFVQQQMQRAADIVPGAGMSIPGAGAFLANAQQLMAQQQAAQAPSNMYGGMPMLGGQPSQQYRAGSNMGRANPFRRADGSVITPEAYMAGDRQGMTGRSNYQGTPGQTSTQRPQLAPPTTGVRPTKTPSAAFGEEQTVGGRSPYRAGTERQRGFSSRIPGSSSFAY